jgi:hypothetical protein
VLYCFAVRSGATKRRHGPVPGFVQVRRNVGMGLYLVYSGTTKRRHRPVLVFSGSTPRRNRHVPGIVKVRRLVDTGMYLVLLRFDVSYTQACTWFIQVRRLVDTGLYLVYSGKSRRHRFVPGLFR